MSLAVLPCLNMYSNSGTPEGKSLIHLDLDPSV